jgi:hypothetical protein
MYGTYAAKAFLVSNVAPLTYIRVLGEQKNDSDNTAGWQTSNHPNTNADLNGGAYGLWVWPSASMAASSALLGTGSLAAVWYVNSGSTIELSGTLWGSGSVLQADEGIGKVITTDSNNEFTVRISGSWVNEFTVRISGSWVDIDEKITFNFSDSSERFVRKAFSTNPQLASTLNAFYPSASAKPYWLGETFEQEVRDR